MKHRPIAPRFIAPLTPCNVAVHRCSVPRVQASRRIVIMRLGAHGDVLMGTPLLAALRRAYPEAHLTWIVENKERASIDANSYVDEILLWDSDYWKRLLRRGRYPLWLVRALAFRRELRRRRFDVFISFQPEEWPLLTRTVGAATRIGIFDTFRQFYGDRPPSNHQRLFTHAYTHTDLPPHRTDQYLLPLKALGLPATSDKQMSLGYTEEDNAVVDRLLAQNGLSRSKPLVVLAPMTTWLSRCWPGDRYAELGDLLARQRDCNIALIGSAKEREAVERIASRMQVKPIMVAGVLTFRQMAALIDTAALLVSGDTGPMHVAAAVKTPYVAIFGPTPVNGRIPLGGLGKALMHPVPCGPCDQEFCPNTGKEFMQCMDLIAVKTVVDAVVQTLRDATDG